MTDPLSLDELVKKYSEETDRMRIVKLMNISGLLNDCIIPSGYAVPEGLHTPLELTPRGKAAYDYARRKNVPFAEARLMCLLEIFGGDLLIDPARTNIEALEREVSRQIKNRQIYYPFIGGRILYNRMASLHDEFKQSLTPTETIELLKETPQGVFQIGSYVTGPYGLLEAETSRLFPPTKRPPLQSCASVTCDEVHPCQLLTDSDAPINENRGTFIKFLERQRRNKATWSDFLDGFTTSISSDYDDHASTSVLIMLNDCLDDYELRALTAWLLDKTNGQLRKICDNLGIRGRSSEAVSSLQRAQMSQLIFCCPDTAISKGIDALIRTGHVNVPPTEVRRAVVNDSLHYGPWAASAEIGTHGVRIVSGNSTLPPLRLRRLIEQMYDLQSEGDRDELQWQLRDIEGTSLEQKIREYVDKGEPREILKSLALARRSNVIVASEKLVFEESDRSDDALVNTMLWKLGFDLDFEFDPHRQLLDFSEETALVLRQNSVGSEREFQDKLRSPSMNYFVELESVLDAALAYTTWALTSDHVAARKPFTYHAESERDRSMAILNSARSGDNDPTYGEKNELYALCRGFQILAQALLNDSNKAEDYIRDPSQFPKWASRQHLQRFPLKHTRAFLDLTTDSQDRIIHELKELSRALTSIDVPNLRNAMGHPRREPAQVEHFREGLQVVRQVISRMEENGFCLLPFTATRREVDRVGRVRTVLSNIRGYEVEVYSPSSYEWLRLPPLSQTQHLMQAAQFTQDQYFLRFAVEPDSPFYQMWSDFPRRPTSPPSVRGELAEMS